MTERNYEMLMWLTEHDLHTLALENTALCDEVRSCFDHSEQDEFTEREWFVYKVTGDLHYRVMVHLGWEDEDASD